VWCYYGVAVTALRRVDADFLALPRHLLAEAAVSAALAAGASYADLRVHRITTEHIQLRDGELETSVVTREIGLAVRVIVDGTQHVMPGALVQAQNVSGKVAAK